MLRRCAQYTLAIAFVSTSTLLLHAQSRTPSWPHWRGPPTPESPLANLPLTWSDTSNVKWKVEIPGRGFSTPVAWGDRLFLTTAIPTGKKAAAARRRRWPAAAVAPAAAAGVGEEHRFEVLAIDRATGKVVWQNTATTAIAARGLSPPLWQLRLERAGDRWPARLRVLRLTRAVRLRPQWQAALAEGSSGSRCRCASHSARARGVVVDDGRVYLQFDHQQEGFDRRAECRRRQGAVARAADGELQLVDSAGR